MIERICEKPEIYNIHIPLPNNPLKNLNCYVMKTDAGSLVIDTGFAKQECLDALTAGLRELDVDMDHATLYITHLHADHTGLVDCIRTNQTRVIMGAEDYRYMGRIFNDEIWTEYNRRLIEEGFPAEDILTQKKENPVVIYAPKEIFAAESIKDGESFFVGDYEFESVSTPGHTPGNTCLYLKKEKIMFTGDHILFDISPNITCWPFVRNSLEDYLISLDKITSYDIDLALPAHRKNEMDVYERIAQLKSHHHKRLQEIFAVVKKQDYQNAYEIAGQLKWSLRENTWQTCPIRQRWFATGETLSHLDYLVQMNRIIKVKDGDLFVYRAK